MRTFVCSVLLWVFLIPVAFAPPVLAQTAARGDDKPNLGDLLRDGLIKGLEGMVVTPPKPNEPNTQTEKETTPKGTERTAPPTPKDTEGPVISVSNPDFTSKGDNATIAAIVTDNSGRVRGAFIDGPNGRRALKQVKGQGFAGTYPVIRDYKKMSVVLMAIDHSGNWSKKTPVTVRYLPGCGTSDSVSLSLVKRVQRDLNALRGYGLGVDGLAGPNTCNAIRAEKMPRGFEWPWLARTLRQRVALSRISIDVMMPEEITEEIVPLNVSVVDPLKSGAVGWVSMQLAEGSESTLPNRQKVLNFELRMNEGERRKVTFVAQDEVGGKRYATKTVELYRLQRIMLDLSSAELTAGKIASESADVTLSADLSGTNSGQISYEITGQGGRGEVPYKGAPVSIALKLPAPGQTVEVVFQGRSGRRVAQPATVLLERLIVHVPDRPQMEIWLGRSPGMDQPPILVADTSPASVDAPQHAPKSEPDLPPEVDLHPPVKRMADWLIPTLVVSGLVIGVVLLRRLMNGDQGLKIVTDIRLVAVPDKTPIVEVTGTDRPGLILRVEPGGRDEAVVTFEEEYEEAAQ